MTASKKAAKFFCEHCGAEVPRLARVCKKCGRFFSSVRCPSCGKTGEAAAFSDGCPYCGYAVKNNLPADDAKKNPPPAPNAAAKRHDPLPPWLYLVCAAALAGLLGALLIGLR